MSPAVRQRVIVTALALSSAGLATWKASEGDGPTAVLEDGTVVHKPYIPTKGDVPTIGHGSTRYEDGTPVRLGDEPITRQRADQLARALASEDEKRLAKSLPGVVLYQAEYDLYVNFVGQFGIGNWNKPMSPRTFLLRGEYRQACEALLNWRFQAGRDCKLPQNWGPQGCKGVWTRQKERYDNCIAAQ